MSECSDASIESIHQIECPLNTFGDDTKAEDIQLIWDDKNKEVFVFVDNKQVE